ncbi:hypothetical protein KFK09_013227 [Dendrobium nobile]|uniref:Uncharacterized protein n=1 Tax=Dendrobium nobile TaxID=94219 RepID=A0A8T3BCJ1_DENNO|nr:hypothetical protein KFK09_013227 [Dendrobium nobile]
MGVDTEGYRRGMWNACSLRHVSLGSDTRNEGRKSDGCSKYEPLRFRGNGIGFDRMVSSCAILALCPLAWIPFRVGLGCFELLKPVEALKMALEVSPMNTMQGSMVQGWRYLYF